VSIASVILADNPVVYYKLDESSGTTATDATGHGNAATYGGPVTYGVAGPGGTLGVRLGSAGSVIGNAVTPVPSRPWSIECWLALTAQGLTNQTVIANFAASVGANLLFQPSGGNTTFNVVRQNIGFSASGGTVSDTNWHHVVWTFDASNNLIIYLDGVQVVNQAGNTMNANNAGSRFQVGTTAASTACAFAHAALYNVVLTPTQVSAHYAVGLIVTSSRTVPASVVLSGLSVLTGRLGEQASRPGNLQPGNPQLLAAAPPGQPSRTIPVSAAFGGTRFRIVPALAMLGGLGQTSALGMEASQLARYMRVGLRAGPFTRTVPISTNFVSLSVLRITQAGVEALTSASPPLRTTQAAVEALTGSSPAVRTTQAALEVLSRVILTLARSVPSSGLISVRQSRSLPIGAVLALPAGYVPVRASLFENTSSLGVRSSRPGMGLVLGASGGFGAVGHVRAVPAQASLQYTTTQARVTQAAVEAVVQGNQARVTQAAIEAGVQGNQARVTQAALDVVLQAGNVRATQALLVALGQFGAVRVTQQPVLVLGQFGGVRVTQQSLVVLTLLRVNNVPATARFSVRGSRTIPLSARLSSGRAIPISAALRATRTRTVPVTAQLGVAVTTVSRAVPITARLAGPSITRTVPLVLKYWQQYTRTVPLAATLTQPRLVPISRSLGFTRVRPAIRLRLYTARQPTRLSRGVPLYMPTALPVSKTIPLSIPAGLGALGQRGVSLQVRLALFGLARTVTLQLLDGGFYSSRGPRWIVATAALLQPSEHTVPLGLVAGDTRPGIHVTKYSLDVTMYQSVDEAQVVISQFVVEVIVPMGQLSSYGQIVG